MTIVVNADDVTLDQVRKQLAKLVATVEVRDFAGTAYIERDLALVGVNCNAEKRREVVEIVELFRGRVVDVSPESIMVELAGTEDKLEAFIDLMKPYGIEALARTGVIAMPRGAQIAKDKSAGDTGNKKRVRSLDAPAAAALPPS
jgi:acetolactate synthase-1/3 small subunit